MARGIRQVSGSFVSHARLALSASVVALAMALTVQPAGAIIVRDDVGIANSVDNANQFGAVVQLFLLDNTNLFGGGIGAIYFNCTGTLINPRTVLTAAHCLRDEGSEDFGQPFAGQDLTSVIGFGVDTFPRLLNFAITGASYNEGGAPSSTDVVIHPSSEPSAGNLPFPWADTALIALDEPVPDVNPLGLLLSPLTSLTHVVQTGYGTFGTGLTGEQGIGTRRLVGENTLGILGSNSDFIDALFPALAPSAVTLGFETQVEYFTDFDNPNRSAPNAGCTFTGSDINCTDLAAVQAIDFFPGNALPREVTTAPGDSGGPLIADQIFPRALVIGNLSGGFTFFNTPADEYGGNGTSFYQPLFSVFQFIVQNDPYKYVGAKAGNGAWEDPNHWVQLLDPNFFIIDANGNIVNGIPAGNEKGIYQTSPKLGTVVGTDISGFSTANSPFIPPEGPASVPVQQVRDASGHPLFANGANFSGRPGSPVPQIASSSSDPLNFGGNLPESSVLLGPGSTGFVPDNTDGVVGTAFHSPAKYFDVTLSEDGTTTLSSVREIDRLTVEGNAGLDIHGTGALLSNIDVELFDNAHLNNDGLLATSDIIADGGVISGNGIYWLGASVVHTDLAAIVLGNAAITAGQPGTVGTMTILGNLAVSSSGMILVDADAAKTDLIHVTNFLGVGGVLAMDGTVLFNSVAGVRPFFHQGGTFAIAGSIVTNGISVPDTVPGVLFPVVTLTHGASADALSITLDAAPFNTAFTATNRDQLTLAGLLDTDRSAYDVLSDLFGELDVQEGAPLTSSIDQLIPNVQRGVQSLGTLGQNALTGLIRQRLGDLRFTSRSENAGGTGFSFNRPDALNVAMNLSSQRGATYLNSEFAQAFAGSPTLLAAAAGETGAGNASAPVPAAAAQPLGGALAGWGGFFSASVLNGSSRFGTRNNDVDGYALMLGFDTFVARDLIVGLAGSATDTTSKLPFGQGESHVRTYQGTVYAAWSDPETMLFANAYAGAGAADIDTHRAVRIGSTAFAAHANPDGSQAFAAVNFGRAFDMGASVWLYPSAGLEYDRFHTDAYSEKGSSIAMSFSSDSTHALLGRIGVEGRGDFAIGEETIVHPEAHASFVDNFSSGSGRFAAAFVKAPGGVASFPNASPADNWFELGAGVSVSLPENADITVGYEATVGRQEANFNGFTGRLRIAF